MWPVVIRCNRMYVFDQSMQTMKNCILIREEEQDHGCYLLSTASRAFEAVVTTKTKYQSTSSNFTIFTSRMLLRCLTDACSAGLHPTTMKDQLLAVKPEPNHPAKYLRDRLNYLDLIDWGPSWGQLEQLDLGLHHQPSSLTKIACSENFVASHWLHRYYCDSFEDLEQNYLEPNFAIIESYAQAFKGAEQIDRTTIRTLDWKFVGSDFASNCCRLHHSLQ